MKRFSTYIIASTLAARVPRAGSAASALIPFMIPSPGIVILPAADKTEAGFHQPELPWLRQPVAASQRLTWCRSSATASRRGVISGVAGNRSGTMITGTPAMCAAMMPL